MPEDSLENLPGPPLNRPPQHLQPGAETSRARPVQGGGAPRGKRPRTQSNKPTSSQERRCLCRATLTSTGSAAARPPGFAVQEAHSHPASKALCVQTQETMGRGADTGPAWINAVPGRLKGDDGAQHQQREASLQGPQARPGDGGCKEFHKSSKEHVSGVFSEHACTGAYMRACVCA